MREIPDWIKPHLVFDNPHKKLCMDRPWWFHDAMRLKVGGAIGLIRSDKISISVTDLEWDWNRCKIDGITISPPRGIVNGKYENLIAWIDDQFPLPEPTLKPEDRVVVQVEDVFYLTHVAGLAFRDMDGKQSQIIFDGIPLGKPVTLMMKLNPPFWSRKVLGAP